MTASRIKRAMNLSFIALSAVLFACKPSPDHIAEANESRRVECLDKLCPGDVPPPYNQLTETVLKLNGQWFVGPKDIFSSSTNGAAFEWWEHQPLAGNGPRPPAAQAMVAMGKGYDIAVEIFLHRRDRSDAFHSAYESLKQAETEGRLLSRQSLRPGLELWRTKEADGRGPGVWYVTPGTSPIDSDPAVLSCREGDPATDRCTYSFLFRPGISGDIRFRAKHAVDWPEIHREALRVLEQLKEKNQ